MTTSTLPNGPVNVARLRNIDVHPQQKAFVDSTAKHIIVRAGRRGGKTTMSATRAVMRFLDGHRQLYAAPTADQMETFWFEVKRALQEPIDAKVFYVNETEHVIEVPRTKQRIRAKTAWNADTLRGDYADDLYLEEWQLMNEDTWGEVGAPMIADNNGTVTFIYTPRSLLSAGVSKAKDPLHAAKMYKRAEEEEGAALREGRASDWATFHFTSWDNPFISRQGLQYLTKYMTKEAYRREILAEDDEAENALLVYSMFDERTQLIDPMPLPKEWPRYVGHDFGQSHPAALFVASDPTGNLYIYDEYLPGPGRSVYQHTEEFKRRTEGLHVMKRIGGNQTTEDEIRQGYSAHGWHIVAPKWAKPAKQIEVVQGLMERNRVFVFKTCQAFLDEIRNCLWEVDKDSVRLDKVRNEHNYHLLSATRYLLSDFTPETVAGYGTKGVGRREAYDSGETHTGGRRALYG